MKRAAQVVTRSTFRSFRALHALRQRRHDSAPLAVAHRRPTGDFVDGAATADAQPCLGVEQANVDARRFQGSAGRLSRRLCRDWGNRKPEAGHSTPAAGSFSSPQEPACSTDLQLTPARPKNLDKAEQNKRRQPHGDVGAAGAEQPLNPIRVGKAQEDGDGDCNGRRKARQDENNLICRTGVGRPGQSKADNDRGPRPSSEGQGQWIEGLIKQLGPRDAIRGGLRAPYG